MNALKALYCRFAGHRWRRLTKKERDAPGIQIMAEGMGGDVTRLRLCRRCGSGYIAKVRKPKLAVVELESGLKRLADE